MRKAAKRLAARGAAAWTLLCVSGLIFGGGTAIEGEGAAGMFSVPAASAASGAASPSGTGQWTFEKTIEPERNARFQSFELDEEVYAGAKAGLEDLRLVDERGQFVPYYVSSGYATAQSKETLYTSSLTASSRENLDSVFDYRIRPLQEGLDIAGNSLLVTLPEQNTLRYVEVSGSHDGMAWTPLGTHDVYRVDRQLKNRISLGQTYKFSYYRLKVLNNTGMIELAPVQLAYSEQESLWHRYERSTELRLDSKTDNRKSEFTIHNPQHLQLREIRLEADGSFKRSYTVTDGEGRPLSVTGKQELFRMDFQNNKLEGNVIRFARPATSGRIVVQVDNQDNPPLQVTKASAGYVVDQVVFESREGGSYKLRYGNPQAVKPQYELGAFRAQIEQEAPAASKLGPERRLTQDSGNEEAGPRWYQSKALFNSIIVAVSLLLVIILFRLMRKDGSAR